MLYGNHLWTSSRGITEMKANIIFKLEQDLKKFHKVLLFLPDCDASFVRNFCIADSFMKAENIRIYMPEAFYDSEKENVRLISRLEIEEILNMYHMYEFSNRLQIIGKSEQYGGLLNYFKTGILTEDEVFKAILF